MVGVGASENRSERNVNQAHASVNLTEADAQVDGTVTVKRAEDVSSLVPLQLTELTGRLVGAGKFCTS